MLMQCPTVWRRMLVGSARGTRQSPFSSLHPWRMAGRLLVVAVVDHRAPVTFVENGDISIVGKGSNTEEQVG